jgi:hypothetical protein
MNNAYYPAGLEPIHQILFNEQASRPCAVADKTCDYNIIGRGGWKRSLDLNLKGQNISIPYSLHEFGLVPVSGAYGDRIHEFTYWPGLSFNPGLWDLETIWKSSCQILLRHDSLCSLSAIHEAWDDIVLFDEEDKLFEHRYTILTHAADLRMGYLPALFFEHIGDVSAYSLNDNLRPWDPQ